MLSNSPTITIENVSKLFHKQEQLTFKELIPALVGGKKAISSFWALKDINLEIKQGEAIGIIGPNGSGKSTLLKLIAGVTKPTKGQVTTNGRIAPLIELGAGFHPELTGRENVYLNGVILGMTRREIDKKFQQIIDFAELWDFIEQPIKHYSSGMYLRLAFSVAIHTEPNILLMDEILAVGDDAFQKKCLAKFETLKRNGTTVVFVSHSLETVTEVCEKAIYLRNGMIQYTGSAADAVRHYKKSR